MAVEEPRYHLVRAYEAFELRRYEPYLVAETVVSAAPDEAGNQGFRILAGYIFGQNKGARRIEMTAPVPRAQSRIAMTAPVAQRPVAGKWAISFMMPGSHTLETLPEPVDPAVVLRQVPSRRVAAVRYSGFWSERRYQRNKAELDAWIKGQGLVIAGDPVWARYNPPFTPWFLRRNEILIPVETDDRPSNPGL